jgi:predicted ATPase
MAEPRLIREIALRNILSYGEGKQTVELRSLNVIIGPNNSGKSNLINVIGLLRGARGDFAQSLRQEGGAIEWLWKGTKKQPIAEIDVTVSYPHGLMPLRHRLSFTTVGQRLELVDEAIEDEQKRDPNAPQPIFYYRFQSGRPVLNVFADPTAAEDHVRKQRKLRREDPKPDQSVLSQKVDKDLYREIT